MLKIIHFYEFVFYNSVKKYKDKYTYKKIKLKIQKLFLEFYKQY